MSDYYLRRDVSAAPTFSSANAKFDFGFSSTEQTVNNLSTDIVELSFDGENVHGVLEPSSRSATLTWTDHRRDRVWVRCPVAAGPVLVEVFATNR